MHDCDAVENGEVNMSSVTGSQSDFSLEEILVLIKKRTRSVSRTGDRSGQEDIGGNNPEYERLIGKLTCCPAITPGDGGIPYRSADRCARL